MNTARTRLTGRAAIDYAEAHDLTLCKYADPVEDERDGLSINEANAVATEDPELVYVDVPATAPLTDEMIRALRSEAEFAGDNELVERCDNALCPTHLQIDAWSRGVVWWARRTAANAINAARAMDDEMPFVRVVP